MDEREKDGVDRARTYETIALLGIKTLAKYVSQAGKPHRRDKDRQGVHRGGL